jgi:endonuclease G
MKIRPDILAAAENRMPPGLTRPEPSTGALQGESFALIGPAEDTSLAKRVENLAFAGARPSTTELERLMGNNDLVDEFYLQRAIVAARPVMRITLRDAAGRERGWATGFMVSPRLLLTNWHVFPTQEETANAVSEANYVLDIAGNPAPSYRFTVRGDLFYLSDAGLDFALVAVDPLAQDGQTILEQFGYHRLVPQPNKIREGECMTIVQHPGGERRQFSIRENRLCRILDQFIWYQSDTAPGSSGAPAFNDSFQVVALHHSGAANRNDQGLYVLRDGTTVKSLEGVDDSRIDWVANEGLRISLLCSFLQANLPPGSAYTQELFQAMQGGDVMSGTLQGRGQPVLLSNPEPVQAPVMPVGNSFTIPLQLQITLALDGTVAGVIPQAGQSGPTLAAPARPLVGEEGLRYPIVDSDYTNRQGYQADFLGVPAPLPKVTRRSLVARMADGKHAIPYEHFTAVIHKQRRLPLFTAANVDYSQKKRRPEPGDYTRNGLGGFGNGGSEKWLTDPRIPEQDQLPDVFYTKDGGSFDKGHVIRREDVCWGTTYAQVVRGNGDTFHVTNCTPQVLVQPSACGWRTGATWKTRSEAGQGRAAQHPIRPDPGQR